VSTKQPNPATARALRAFLAWVIAPCGGNARANLDRVHFVGLPEYIRALGVAQIEKIQ
jgi:phosphate transport system substrate-binding protein